MKFYYYSLALLCLFGCKMGPDSTETSKSFATELNLQSKTDSILFRTAPDLDRPHPSVIRVYDKLNFGNGYNSTTGQEYFSVMDFEGTKLSSEIAANAKGNRGQVTMEIIESKEQLKTALNISAKADLNFKMGLWSSNNSLKLNTMRDTEFNSFSQHALLKASYANEPLVLIDPQMKQELIDLATRDPETFMRTCGDMFVSRIYTGGELYTLYSLNSRDSREKEQNELFFETTNEYLGNTLDVSVQASAMNQSVSNIKNINTTVITEGGFKTPTTTDMSSYIEYANAFKEQVSADNRAVILYVELSPYESLAGFPKIDFSKIRVLQRSVLDAASEALYAIEEDKNNADFVQEHPELFKTHHLIRSVAVKKRYEQQLRILQKIISDCQADPDYCSLSDLDFMANHEPFNPSFKFPEWEGERTKLPLETLKEWTLVFADTGKDGMLLSVQGELELRMNTADKPHCRAAVGGRERVLISESETTTGMWFWKKKHKYAVYLRFDYPYYKVRYRSKETQKVLKEFVWKEPIITEANVIVEMQYHNPHGLIELKHNGKTFIEGTYGQAYYPIVQSCDAAKEISALIAPKNAKPKADVDSGGLMTTNKNTPASYKRPDGNFEGNYFQYDYNWDNED